jgi:hypothetical protein
MWTFATLLALMSALVLPTVASDPFGLHAQIRPYLQPRGILETRALEPRDLQTPTLVLSQDPKANYPTATIGIVGEPLVLSQAPTPTPTLAAAGKVGEPLYEQQSGIVGTALAQVGKVGQQLSQEGTFSTAIEVPTNTAHPISSTSPASGLVGSPIATSSSFFTEHSIIPTLVNWAVLVIIVASSLVFITLVGLLIWRVRKYRNGKNQQDDDEEDIIEAYAKYWKTKQKRNSGGIVGRGNISSPFDEKMGRRSYI